MMNGDSITVARRRIRSFREKNSSEIAALLSGRMPDFVTRPRSGSPEGPIVFVFHAVHPDTFESQLKYLSQNSYRALRLDEAVDAIRNRKWPQRSVLLTFDDATSTFWVYALPLLQRYRMPATLFAIAGLVPDGKSSRPTLNERWAGAVTDATLEDAVAAEPLCNWEELRACAGSGWVDVQSHSLTHSRIPVASTVIDVQAPGYPVGPYANSDLPLSSLDHPRSPNRKLRPGAPVFAYDSRFSDAPRFLLHPDRESEMIDYVHSRGGEEFFTRPGWRKRWFRKFGTDQRDYGTFETKQQQSDAIEHELSESRKLLEERLGSKVADFCLPWFGSGMLAAKLALVTGYRSFFFGVNRMPVLPDGLIGIPRVSEHYCMRLPGTGRVSLGQVWLERLRQFKQG